MLPNFQEIKDKIIDFQFLEKGWDSYDSQRIEYSSIVDATEVLDYIEVYILQTPIIFKYTIHAFPCSDGAVSIELNIENGNSLELHISSTADFFIEYFLEINGITEQDSISNIDELDDVLERAFL